MKRSDDLNKIFPDIGRSSARRDEGKYYRQLRLSPKITIISGGQSGVDSVGLQVGSFLGLPTYAIMPENCRREGESIDAFVRREGLNVRVIALASESYRFRTYANAYFSDMTIVYDFVGSEGTRATVDACACFHRPCAVLSKFGKEMRRALLDRLLAERPKIINIAGNSADKIGQAILSRVYEELSLVLRAYCFLSQGKGRTLSQKFAQKRTKAVASGAQGQGGTRAALIAEERDERREHFCGEREGNPCPEYRCAEKELAFVRRGFLRGKGQKPILVIPNFSAAKQLFRDFIQREYKEDINFGKRLVYPLKKFILVTVRPREVLRMVAKGADLGFVGEDLYFETDCTLPRLLDTGLIPNATVLVSQSGAGKYAEEKSVCSQYPHFAKALLERKGDIAEISGSAEAYLSLGLYDFCVDTLQTGYTAEQNGVTVRKKLAETSLIAVGKEDMLGSELLQKFIRYLLGGEE